MDKVQPAHRERVLAYAGPAYTGESDRSKYDPVGQAFSSISRWTPTTTSGAPRVTIGSSREEGRSVAKMLEAGTNRLIVQSNMRQLNEMLAVDFRLGPFAVCLTTVEPIPGFSEYDDPPHWPAWHRIPPFDFLWDTDENIWTNWRFMGHRVVVDHEDAIEEAKRDPASGWNLEMLERIAPGIVSPKAGMPPNANQENREQFEYFPIWCPEIQAEHLSEMGYDPGEEDDFGRTFDSEGGYNGAIFYVLPNVDAGEAEEFIRAPRPFYGPRWGPYAFFPGYFVPEEPLPLAPEVATAAQAEAENTGHRAMLRAIERGKRIGVVAADSPDLADLLEEAVDGDIVQARGVEDLSKKVANLQTGGPYAELIASVEYLRDLRLTAAGEGEGQTGQYGDKKTTATEVAVASRATSSVQGFQALKFRESLTIALRTAAWYLFHDERAEIALGVEHAFGVFRGGPDSAVLRRSPERHEIAKAMYGSVDAAVAHLEGKEREERETRKQDPFDAMDFSIDQWSMEKTVDGMAQAQMLAATNTLPWMIQILQLPYVRPKEFIQFSEDISGLHGLEKVFDVEALIEFRQLAMQMQLSQSQAGGGERLGRDQAPQVTLNLGAAKPSPTPTMAQPQKLPIGGASLPGRSTGSMAGAKTKSMKGVA